jgi:RNA polymerase sigma factor (sigma-70 family)
MAYDIKTFSTEELLQEASRPEQQDVFAAAVAELVMRYKSLVYSQALWVCGGNQALADDVFQDTFIRLFTWLQRRGGRTPIHSFSRLLKTFAKRAAIDLLRKEKRELPAPESEVDERWGTHLYVMEILELLDPRSRDVLWMTYFEGLSATEIAKRLKIKAGNVRILRFRALELLRECENRDKLADLVEEL